MATNNSVDVGLSGATGTGNFVGATSPTLITPTLGVSTATSIAFSPTTGGIIGTTAADNAGAGYVGQFITSNIAFASATSLSNSTAKNVTSISLTAGDWDIFGNVYFSITTGTIALAYTSTTTAGSLPDNSLFNEIFTPSSSTNIGIQCPYLRVSISSPGTVYLIAYSQFSVSATACGSIFARRVR